MPGPAIKPLTPEEFRAWKESQDKAKAIAKKQAAEQRRLDIEEGRVQMTGKELYDKHPELFDGY